MYDHTREPQNAVRNRDFAGKNSLSNNLDIEVSTTKILYWNYFPHPSIKPHNVSMHNRVFFMYCEVNPPLSLKYCHHITGPPWENVSVFCD